MHKHTDTLGFMSQTSALPLSLSLNPVCKGGGQTGTGHINQTVWDGLSVQVKNNILSINMYLHRCKAYAYAPSLTNGECDCTKQEPYGILNISWKIPWRCCSWKLRDRSGGEEQQAGSQRTICTLICWMFKQHWLNRVARPQWGIRVRTCKPTNAPQISVL